MSGGHARTLGKALQENGGVGPGFHFLRHALSFGVVLVHCRAASYWATSAALIEAGAKLPYHPGAAPLTLNDLLRPVIVALVATFFALSGFLVTGSALRTKQVRLFFANRALRIVPALSVEVTLSALILGPIFTMWALRDYFTSPMFFRYFANILGFVTFHLPGVFKNHPWTDTVNGNLWTLPAEFWCYALMMIVLKLRIFQNPRVLLGLVCAGLVIITIGNFVAPEAFTVRGPNAVVWWYIVFIFWIGSVFYVYADYIPLNIGLFALSAIMYYLSILFNVLVPLAAIPLCYCMAYIGMTRFPLWDRMVKSDYSYGIYLYGFPIMQAWVGITLPWLVGWKPPSQLLVLFPLTITTTVLFAAISWRLVEKPALKLRKVFLPATPVQAVPAAVLENATASFLPIPAQAKPEGS